ncbi:MAG TPA: hypothetical protein VF988_01155, partial [Verrucomicrobiae bacterium]
MARKVKIKSRIGIFDRHRRHDRRGAEKGKSLSDTEGAENGIEQIFGRGFAHDFAHGVGGNAQ